MEPDRESPPSLLQRLPLSEARAVGGPVSLPLLASYFRLALLGWLAATGALVLAAPQLARGEVTASRSLLAAHLLALGFLPLAVAGGTFHLLPVMLRNPLASERRLWLALPCLVLGASLAAPGIAFTVPAALWPGAALLLLGLCLVLFELTGLIVRAPGGRLLLASRTGVALSLFHVVAALTLGTIVYDHGDTPLFGVTHARWVLVHLHLAVFGWLALLILTVGRTLAPMLALAPAASRRRWPLEEFALTLGLWLLAAGIASSGRPLSFAGVLLLLLALGRFATLVARTVRTRQIEPEGPLLHLVAGAAFLAQAAALGIALLAGIGPQARGIAAYVLLLLLGWAAGVTIGHLPKLLSLSIWVWWPPGPRPKQAAIYPRRLAQLESVAFAAGVETLAIAVYVGDTTAARIGAVIVLLSAALASVVVTVVWQKRSRGRRTATETLTAS